MFVLQRDIEALLYASQLRPTQRGKSCISSQSKLKKQSMIPYLPLGIPLICESIIELRRIFLQNRFKENTVLSIKNCPDVTQFALESQGDGVYFEYLTQSKDRYEQLIPGVSTNPTNINQIGSSAN